jgi:hypothetical protein
MKNKDRKLVLCRDYGRSGTVNPCVLIKGIWFRQYGFSPGEQVTISNPEPGVLVMKKTLSRKQMNCVRAKRNLDHTIRDYEQKFGKAA